MTNGEVSRSHGEASPPAAISTWLTAIAGAAILLVAYHLITSRSSGSIRSGRSRRGWSLRRAHR